MANESTELTSELFRGDVLKPMPRNHTDQERALGFSALTGVRETLTDEVDAYGRPKTRPTRLSEIVFHLSEFRQIFRRFKDRCLVRSLTGCTSVELPSRCSLLSLEEYTRAVRSLNILPKRRRLAFVLVLYDNGICRGSCFFPSSVKEYQVDYNEQVLSEDLFTAPVLDVKLQSGPFPTKSLAYPEWRLREDQRKAFIAMEEQYRDRMHLYSQIQLHAASYVEAQRVIPVPDRALRLLTLKYYDEEMEDRSSSRGGGVGVSTKSQNLGIHVDSPSCCSGLCHPTSWQIPFSRM